ncbi:hypothetical protein CJ255_15115 [Candidatus Viridilinea mediisalina]|uniref:Uncharacterized protein n=2 Tax=Candidatus Viridilinea mediisalina TaxID=2024553 RepID=A0A2A6RGZ4_9CHLR|nr:hypothetical protein CJ255_15115 [Candidatus Viridilinea mediisalina]
MRWRWTGLLLAALFIGLSFEHHGWLALAVAAAALVGYYRLLPLYPLFALRSVTARWHRPDKPPLPALPELQQLPPHLDKVLWLPIPGHARLLAAAFREDAAGALAIIEQMRASPYPGYGPTVRRALPLIVADQLALVASAESLAALPSREAGLLPQLVPSFYQLDAEDGARLAGCNTSPRGR